MQNSAYLPFRLLGQGRYLPRKIVKSTEIDARAGWPEGTTEKKFRIRQRHFAGDDETVTVMGAAAAQEALREAGLEAKDLDLLIQAGCSVEQPIPYQAALTHRALGLERSGIPCFDIDTTCLSFVMALQVAGHFLASGAYKRIAIVTSEIASIAINWEVPECFTLFGDGAACWVLGADPERKTGLLAHNLRTYSYGAPFCEMRAGATRFNIRRPPPSDADYLFSMDGPEAFKLAVKYFQSFLEELFAKAGLGLRDMALFAPHQASPLALHHMKGQLDIPDEQYVNYISDYGNQVSASIPLALYRAREEGRWKSGQNILLAGTSAGISLGAAVLRPMKILITGATGSLGSRLVSAWAGQHELTGTGRKAFSGQEQIRFLRGDLADRDFADSLAAGQEVVVHCAALAAPWGRWEEFERANIQATRYLVEACRKHGVRQLVHISTPSIYYAPRDRLLIQEEETLPPPATYYARSKLAAEQLVRQAEGPGLRTVLLRPRGIFGPTDQVILPKILRLLRKGYFPLLRGGRPLVDLTYVDNVIHAIDLCVKNAEACSGQAINISNGEPIAVRELVELIAARLELKFRWLPLPIGLSQALAGGVELAHSLRGAPGEPALTRYGLGLLSFDQTLNLSKARALLGYAPRIPLRDGIASTLEALR